MWLISYDTGIIKSRSDGPGQAKRPSSSGRAGQALLEPTLRMGHSRRYALTRDLMRALPNPADEDNCDRVHRYTKYIYLFNTHDQQKWGLN